MSAVPTTLSQLLNLAKKPLWRGKAYETTAQKNVEQFIALMGDLPLKEVKTTTMDDWRKAIEANVKGSTVNRKLVNIKQVLRFAVERDWMAKMPIAHGETETPGRVRWLSNDEESTMFTLLAEWEEQEVAKFVKVLIATGLRRGELLSLTPEQIDGRWIRLWVTKTKTPRSVPITEAAQEALQGFEKWSINEVHLRKVWDRLRVSMKLTGDADFVLHMLRHTTATRLLKKTRDVTIVQKMLGHKKIQTTLRYAHIEDDDFFNAVTQ